MSKPAPKMVALIPARSGSKRIQNKNVRTLGGHPLLAYAIRGAIESKIFESVICATDSDLYAAVALHYGAEVPFLRSGEISGDKSPDIEWVVWMLNRLKEQGREFDAFSILRPTNPFRSPVTIRRASKYFLEDGSADSLRAIEKCKQHPGKMWAVKDSRMLPLLPFENGGTPWHSCQYASLPEIYVQNASLEIAWTRIALEKNTIAGESIIPFISEGLEGFDINEPDDWWMAERLIQQNGTALLSIDLEPFCVEKF